jgi:hypothetical protein
MAIKKDDWSLKEYQPKGSPERWFFRKNLAPEIAPRHPSYGSIAYLTFAYVPRDESGLPSIADEETLFEIEDKELAGFEADSLAIQVGSVTKSGIKDLLFYTRDGHEFLRRAERFRSEYPQFKVGCQIGPDPQWAQYDDFP